MDWILATEGDRLFQCGIVRGVGEDQLDSAVNQYFVHILSLVTDKTTLLNLTERGEYP